MFFLNPIVISKKIHKENHFTKSKSFAASFGVHVSLLAAVTYLTSSHPIPLPQSEHSVVISLAQLDSASGDINRLESLSKDTILPSAKREPLKVEKTQLSPTTKTSLERPLLTPSVSLEASAPLAHAATSASTPPNTSIDSPQATPSAPLHELPKPSITGNELGGAALGHIRAMIEKAITYPSIARKLRLEGVVLVTFVLKPDGTVETAHVKSTSGSNLLDTKAIQTILSLSGDYPALGKTFELSIPIAFNLHKS